MEERIQKILSRHGIASRRQAEAMIAAGRVAVNGVAAHLGDTANAEKDEITLDGHPISQAPPKCSLMLHKPRGYLTAMGDDRGRKCVSELVEDIPERVYPVGRLDLNSEGLLLMTNNGEFANLITHPSHEIPKCYRVTVHSTVTDEQQVALATGIELDGRKTAPAEVKVVTEEEGRTVMLITIVEGRNREIRRMCEAVGLEVARLKRISIGSLRLGMLQPGKYRELTDEEVGQLISAARSNTNKAVGRPRSRRK